MMVLPVPPNQGLYFGSSKLVNFIQFRHSDGWRFWNGWPTGRPFLRIQLVHVYNWANNSVYDTFMLLCLCILYMYPPYPFAMTYNHIIILTYICVLYLHLWDLGLWAGQGHKVWKWIPIPNRRALPWIERGISSMCFAWCIHFAVETWLPWCGGGHGTSRCRFLGYTLENLTCWTPKMEVWMMMFVLNLGILRFHVDFCWVS